ncbi:MAG TPA: hypothetical protein VNI20_00175, partial [Fimbriimonadaceae bacterium]|nr:hypothetical protein [Fimbriimonadaceae bacterium]
MFKFKTVLLAVLGLAPFVAHATDEFDFYFADVAILQAKEVQRDLGVTNAQRDAMNVHATWLNTKRNEIAEQVKGGKLTADDADKKMTGYLMTLKKDVLGELTDSQLKRLREITLQRDGLLPLLDQKMADRLKISASQLKTLRDGFIENNKKAQALSDKVLKPIKDKYEGMHPKSVA